MFNTRRASSLRIGHWLPLPATFIGLVSLRTLSNHHVATSGLGAPTVVQEGLVLGPSVDTSAGSARTTLPPQRPLQPAPDSAMVECILFVVTGASILLLALLHPLRAGPERPPLHRARFFVRSARQQQVSPPRLLIPVLRT
jgi:hypothetical protein